MMDFKDVVFFADKQLFQLKLNNYAIDDKLEKILGQLGDKGAYPTSLTLANPTSKQLLSVFDRGIESHDNFVPSILYTPLDIPTTYQTKLVKETESVNNQGNIFTMNYRLFGIALEKKKIE